MIDYTKTLTQDKKAYDLGLRHYMLKIYNYMAGALVLTAVVAFLSVNVEPLRSMLYVVSSSGDIVGRTVFGSMFFIVPLIIAIFFGSSISSMSSRAAYILFLVYAGSIGIFCSNLILIYDSYSIVKTFFIAASVFGATSIYGYSTNRDLTNVGSFFIMGLIGIIVVSIINFFAKSSALDFAVSLIGVAVFIGLTAWDTQKLKSMYYSHYSSNSSGVLSGNLHILGALTLYLDFINLFLHLLRFIGNRR
ncbi:Bax inhibitor-1/YccA family protein [Rickettsia endosymbiont of Cardiosporidium cionae]|uniref:Bax inhibitor-1/YccA family protein n=1 Tax=Rickettsia endosymbiont of Cardiosporidium cionae TaxID=2777155 RepID=UPI0018933EC7|nr:Bax inhibitor-1/YccA family protein [Rickettsia endosymbiont of Cardiosporidium cionae]KAF8818895.1 Bax inhibitor-1/YccA family protein [Rickettsia endosymbiont of Cardiosporidium cionae]